MLLAHSQLDKGLVDRGWLFVLLTEYVYLFAEEKHF